MDVSVSQVGSGQMTPYNRVICLAVSCLAITGIILTILAALQGFSGVGSISSVVLGGVDILIGIAIFIYIRHKTAAPPPTYIVRSTPEQLAHVKWHNRNEESRKLLASFVYNDANYLSADQRDTFTPQPQDKLVLVVQFAGYTDLHECEIGAPNYKTLERFRQSMGNNFLVLFNDVEHRYQGAALKEHTLEASQPNSLIWGQLFNSNRWLTTNDPNWQSKLDTWIAQ